MSSPKTELRRMARERRKALVDSGFALAIASYAEDLPIRCGLIVGGYHALPEEADPSLLLARLVELECQVAFPRVAARDQALDFHHVPDGEVLEPGSFGIPEPLEHWPPARPDLLLVPLLAFDAHGHRLGYGGGFYDRTLALLGVPAIGIAYAGQEVASLPRGPHDMALEMVVTEKGARKF
ncbi:MAG TPA: 5-formyltetrahydrofolate cyclo-ligase [Rhizomicrobium sp.]|nr:5-formyltetrahydrofolate cyclo-ligase [Rhizomicrobium sp.]